MPRSPARPLVVVFDTSVLLSALLFANGRLAPLRALWHGPRCEPLVSQATAAELVRALGYPKFKLSPAQQEELLADYLPCCRSVQMPARLPALPACRDPNDPFLALAAVGKADFLVTGDKDLLVLSEEFGGRIVKAQTLLGRL